MITIQRPTRKDVKDIQKVFYETWLSTYPDKKTGVTIRDIKERFKDRFSKKAIQKRTAEILDKSDNQLFLVAKDGDVIIGVCKVEKKETYNELQAIYILPSYQGRGIGMMFWKIVNKFFGNEKNIVVHVATYNEQAINFYQKIGFIDTGKRFTKEKHKMLVSGTLIPEMELIIKARISKFRNK